MTEQLTTMDRFKQFNDKYNRNEEIKPFSTVQIDDIQNLLKVKLPKEYIDLVSNYGAIYSPELLDKITDKEIELSDIQEFLEPDQIVYDKQNEWSKDLDLIPIAMDCMGNLLGYSENEIKVESERAGLYFFDHDFDTFEKISDSLTDYIDKLTEI